MGILLSSLTSFTKLIFFIGLIVVRYKKSRQKENQNLVADFLGLPIQEKTLFLPEPDSISKVIDKIWEEWSMDNNDSPQEIISQNWQRILGPKLCNRCAPEKLDRKGILYLRAANGPIKQEISFLKKQILQRVNKLKGCNFIKEIKVF